MKKKPILFYENPASVIVQQNIQNTHTRWNADIEFDKIHLAYGTWKHTQDEMHLTKNYFVAYIKETHFLKSK